MTERSEPKSTACCEEEPIAKGVKCCQVDALITIDGRGQIVLPKDVREKADVKAGDKFAVINYESNGKVCCIFLVKANDFSETIKGTLEPMMKDMLK